MPRITSKRTERRARQRSPAKFLVGTVQSELRLVLVVVVSPVAGFQADVPRSAAASAVHSLWWCGRRSGDRDMGGASRGRLAV